MTNFLKQAWTKCLEAVKGWLRPVNEEPEDKFKKYYEEMDKEIEEGFKSWQRSLKEAVDTEKLALEAMCLMLEKIVKLEKEKKESSEQSNEQRGADAPDYQNLYTTLFNRVSGVIEELQQAQRETEEMYITEREAEDAGPVV